MLQMDDGWIVVVRDERARLAALVPFGVKHEVVSDQLTSAIEESSQRFLAVRTVEHVLLFNLFPRQLAAPLTQLVSQSRELLLFEQQILAGGQPFLFRDNVVNRHFGTFLCKSLCRASFRFC